MLTRTDYTNLWTNPAPGGFSQVILTLPSYDEYVIRENQLQDYLDIFRGINTRPLRLRVGEAPIERNVDWCDDHPFSNELNGKAGAPKIEYIMIGEAAPNLSEVLLPGYYFYNINHVEHTRYFSDPCNAFGVVGVTKVDKLVALARKRVLLLDIFPFATNYCPQRKKKGKTFRDELNQSGVTRNFWVNVGEEITSLRNNSLLHKETKLAFIAPPTISHFIAEGINRHDWPTFDCTARLGVNKFSPAIPIPSADTHFKKIPKGTNLLMTSCLDLRLTITTAPFYACCCYDGSNYPQSIYITSAFTKNKY
jgi:hypothetical protein